MKKNRILTTLAAALALVSGVVQAHTHLEEAMPADNSVLASPPSQITLHFSEVTRLTSVSVHREEEKEPALSLIFGKEKSAEVLTVPLTPLAPGKYTVKWRAVGADNHVMSGTLHFSVTGK